MNEAKGGGDPALARDAGRKAPTMKQLGKRFLEDYVPDHCKPSTAYEHGRSVKFFIDPRIGSRKVRDIKRSDIAELHHALRETPYQANRTLGVLSKMFSLSEMWGWRPDGSNPCLHVKRYREEKRERFLNAEEFARLGRVLDDIIRDGSETHSAVVAIRLLMLTGCRLSEIQKLRWEHVDLEAGEFRLPDTKTGGRAVPLAPSAVRLLESLPRDEDNPWVIAGRKPGSHLTDLQHPWRRIRARAELGDVRIHDLRHSFASRALALGEGLPMIGKQIAPTSEALLEIAAKLDGAPGLELQGLLTHAGQAYDCRSIAAIAAVAEEERSGVATAAWRLRDAGLPCPVVSVGSTPTALWAANSPTSPSYVPASTCSWTSSRLGLAFAGWTTSRSRC